MSRACLLRSTKVSLSVKSCINFVEMALCRSSVLSVRISKTLAFGRYVEKPVTQVSTTINKQIKIFYTTNSRSLTFVYRTVANVVSSSWVPRSHTLVIRKVLIHSNLQFSMGRRDQRQRADAPLSRCAIVGCQLLFIAPACTNKM